MADFYIFYILVDFYNYNKLVVNSHSCCCCRTGCEEENIYAKVDDMIYYPVVENHEHKNIINNVLYTLPSKARNQVNLHQVNLAANNSSSSDMATINTFGTLKRSRHIYL